MKTADLIEHGARAAGLGQNAAKKAVETAFGGILDAAKKGDAVDPSGSASSS